MERFFAASAVRTASRAATGPRSRGPVCHRARLGLLPLADGYAVTNHHVVDGADKVEVTTDDGKTYTAR